MSAPQRIQRKRTKGWRMPEGARYVGRPSRWGNPFLVCRVDCSTGLGMCWAIYAKGWGSNGLVVEHIDRPDEAHRQAVELFELHIGPMGSFEYSDEKLAAVVTELGGRDLACWCPPAYACHADVLLRLANEVAA